MSLYAYRVFEEVCNKGSFVNAAKSLNLTASAVSHTIAKLEDEFGFALFTRNRAGAVLTDSGRRIAPYVRALNSCAENINQEVSRIKNFDVGSVTIGLFSSVASNWFVKILLGFREQHPGIDILINQGSYQDILRWIDEKRVDIAFTTEAITERLDFTPLWKDNLICLVPDDFVPLNETFVIADDFKHTNLIINKECETYDTYDFIADNGIQVGSYYDFMEHQTLFAMVQEGFGVCIMPELVANTAPPQIRRLPLLGKDWTSPYRLIGVTMSEPNSVSPACKLLKKSIIEYVEGLSE